MSPLMLAAVLAATPITLEEARKEGRTNTQALQSLLDVNNAQGDVGVARGALLPQVNLSAGAGWGYVGRQRVFTTVPDPAGGFVQQAVETPSTQRGTFDFAVSLNQIIYDRARWKQLEQSGARVEAAQGQAREQSATSELEAIVRFFGLYRTQATIGVLRETVKRSEEQVERARAMFKAGRVGKGEEISAQVNLGNDRVNVLRREGQEAIDQTQLAVWLARPGTSDLTAVDPGIAERTPAPAPSRDEAIAVARSHRPLLAALQQQVRAASLGVDVASSGYIPRLTGDALYVRRGPNAGDVFTEPRLQNNLSVGLGLQWDLFNGFSTGAQTDKARSQLRKAELTYAQTERELEAKVVRALRVLETQLEVEKVAAQNRQSAVLGLSLQDERFRSGVGSTLEVRDAQLKLTQAELSLLESRIDVEIARYSLLRAMGTLSPGESR
ncbi:TolC family protein [Myxococcaceae bacterium GXIMD 01537]